MQLMYQQHKTFFFKRYTKHLVRFSSTLLSNLKNHSDRVIQTGTGSELLQNSARSQYQTVRSFKQHFKPSVWKRAHKHGLDWRCS
jgi:hypothetical protein